MDIAELVKIFQKHEYYKRMGKGKLARHFKCTTEEIKKAKALAYENGNTKTLPKVLILDEPTAGMGLAFITLPAVFGELPAGNLFGVLFFFLFLVAALTSSISYLETIIA